MPSTCIAAPPDDDVDVSASAFMPMTRRAPTALVDFARAVGLEVSLASRLELLFVAATAASYFCNFCSKAARARTSRVLPIQLGSCDFPRFAPIAAGVGDFPRFAPIADEEAGADGRAFSATAGGRGSAELALATRGTTWW